MDRGEVWQVNLDPGKKSGSKINLNVVIVNDDKLADLPHKIVVPLYDWDQRFSKADWCVKITPTKTNNLPKTCRADAASVKIIPNEFLIKKIGRLSPSDISKVNRALENALEL